MNFTGLKEAENYLRINFPEKVISKENWSPYKTFVHCAQTIDYSMTGYPEYKPLIIQYTIGKIVLAKFLRQGFMTHNLQAPVPGAPEIAEEGDIREGLELLLSSLIRFREFSGNLHRHLIFGKLSKEEYDKYFCMHIVEHLSEFSLKGE